MDNPEHRDDEILEIIAEHRGLRSAEMMFVGNAGHASAGASSSRSAVHDAIRWSAARTNDWTIAIRVSVGSIHC